MCFENQSAAAAYRLSEGVSQDFYELFPFLSFMLAFCILAQGYALFCLYFQYSQVCSVMDDGKLFTQLVRKAGCFFFFCIMGCIVILVKITPRYLAQSFQQPQECFLLMRVVCQQCIQRDVRICRCVCKIFTEKMIALFVVQRECMFNIDKN